MGDINLFKGDCLEGMKNIPDNSVDVLISDIPYGISFSKWDIKHNNNNSALMGKSPSQNKSNLFKVRGKPKNGWSKKDIKIGKEFEQFCFSWLSEAKRLLKPASSILCFTGRQHQHNYINACEKTGIIFKDTISWNKTKAPFRAQRVSKVFERRGVKFDDDNLRLGNLAPIIEPIVWCFNPYKIGGTITDCFEKYSTGLFSSEFIQNNLIDFNSNVKEKKHETQKPIGLMTLLIKTFTLENQTVLDPFMGSGTTGVACVNTDRKFIGIEISKKYFEVANKRIADAINKKRGD